MTDTDRERGSDMTEWKQSQAKRFAKDVVIGQTYYTINQQSDHAATYGPAQTYSEHVFTGRSLISGLPMTDGRTSAYALCNNKGPVYDERPEYVRPSKRDRHTDREDRRQAEDFNKRARGLFGGKR